MQYQDTGQLTAFIRRSALRTANLHSTRLARGQLYTTAHLYLHFMRSIAQFHCPRSWDQSHAYRPPNPGLNPPSTARLSVEEQDSCVGHPA